MTNPPSPTGPQPATSAQMAGGAKKTGGAEHDGRAENAGGTPSSALAPMDFAGRLASVRAAMVDAELDVLALTDPANVRWLSGFTGSHGQVLVRVDSLTLVTDPRYEEQLAQELDAAGVDAAVHILRSGDETKFEHMVAAGGGAGAGARVGVEAYAVTKAQWDLLSRTEPPGGGAAAELVPVAAIVAGLRQRKDDGEVARLRRAAGIADRALAQVAARISAGVTEAEIAAEIDYAMRRAGADGIAFETIVAGGPNAAKPHARPSARPLAPGDLLIIDMGARFDGYHSDMTRTLAVGALSREQARWVEAVLAAQAAGVEMVAAGVATQEVDARCREVLAGYGLDEYFTHGTGHSIGLEIHEQPMLSKRSEDILAVGHVVTVEPGVYVPGVGGVRIEDTVLVTPTGAEPLTLSPKIDVSAVG